MSTRLLRRLVALAAAQPGREVCGLLLGTPDGIADILPATNVAADPAVAFEIDPAIYFDALRRARAGAGAAVVGHYHSHPHGPPEPSAADAAAAHDDGALWLILGRGRADHGRAGVWRAAAWRAGDGGSLRRRFHPVSLIVAEPAGCGTSA